ncbi:trans-sulfuration enzyme family protein [Dermacoccaceae bacterium W4C1]
MDPHSLDTATHLVRAGRPHGPGAGLNPPVDLNSTYVAGTDRDYARGGNHTWDAFEAALGPLEGGQALAFASGMGAISAVLALVPVGGTVVAPTHAYSGTGAALTEAEREGRLRVRRVAIDDTAAVQQALAGADLLWVESPTNPMLEVADLPALFSAARAAGAIGVCDNTFSTPLLQRPLADGADIVVHSATKYLAGHADVLMGATVTADPQVHQRLLTRRTLGGAVPGPMEVWLALRGMRTLHLRVERSCDNAAELARRLEGHPLVERLRYPGSGAILAIEPVGGEAAARRVEEAVQVFTCATSLGGVESLLERRRRHPLEPASVPESLLRLSVGIESVQDLIADLEQALTLAHATTD